MQHAALPTAAHERALWVVSVASAAAAAWWLAQRARRRPRSSAVPLKPKVRLISRRLPGAPASAAPAVHSPVVAKSEERRREKARAHVQFGQLLFKSGRLSKAISHYETAVELNPQNALAHYELANTLQQLGEPARALPHYERVLELKPASVETATNLAVAYLAAGRAADAIAMSEQAIELQRARAEQRGAPAAQAINSEAHYNLNAALRACGRADEAYEHTWRAIEAAGGKRYAPISLPAAVAPKPVARSAGWLGRWSSAPALTVVCVKWGTKYGAQYVNKLYKAVRAHTTCQPRFVCYTDDGAGLLPDVQLVQLSGVADWDGWWYKAALFGPLAVKSGRVLYLDLDTIIVGSLDELLSYDGPFATLSTGSFACETDNPSGYNSSVMLWDASACGAALSPLHDGLIGGAVFKHLLRFDHWLEMLLPPAPAGGRAAAPTGGAPDTLQALFPGHIVEFNSECAEELPDGARVVCFPRSPKPHEVMLEWAEQAWHSL